MRFETNLKILETITKGVDLKEYSGFGGLYKVMKQEDHQKLKDILGEKSYNQIMASSKTAYYTPKEIIGFMYKALDRMGFKGGRVLEPACGHGSFIFNMPDSMKTKSSIHAVELDKISTQIAQNICPYANISNCSFERYQEDGFDLIIGNPPYSNTVIYDKDPELNNRVIHHYFLAKSIKLLKEGGILAFVVPAFCLDNLKGHARLLASFRLPDNMFENAKVTVDICFFQKTTNKTIGYDFLKTKDLYIKDKSLPLNEYYHSHPNNVLGKFDTALMYKERIGLTVRSDDSREQVYKQLNSKLDILEPVYISKQDNALEQKITTTRSQLSQLASNDNLQAKLAQLELAKLKVIENEYINFQKHAHSCLKGIQSGMC